MATGPFRQGDLCCARPYGQSRDQRPRWIFPGSTVVGGILTLGFPWCTDSIHGRSEPGLLQRAEQSAQIASDDGDGERKGGMKFGFERARRFNSRT